MKFYSGMQLIFIEGYVSNENSFQLFPLSLIGEARKSFAELQNNSNTSSSELIIACNAGFFSLQG